MTAKNYLTTPEASKLLGIAMPTLRGAHSRRGNYRGVIPIKQFNNALAWPAKEIKALKQAFEKEQEQRRNNQLSYAQQHQIILQALRTGPKSTQAIKNLGIQSVLARIRELRHLGYGIVANLSEKPLKTNNTLPKRAMIYRLTHEPSQPLTNSSSEGL